MKKLFIGGSISHSFENGIFDISLKSRIEGLAQKGVASGLTILSAHIIEAFGLVKLEDDSTIVQRDLNWIDAADVCLFLLPANTSGLPVRTDGTYIELGYAVAKEKEIVVAYANDIKEHYSPMLRGIDVRGIKFIDLLHLDERFEEYIK